MRIGIFGGSFNPIHKGHILIAKEAIKELNLDKLLFIPAYQNPFKDLKDYVDVNHRIKMIEMVLEDKMEICDFEAKRKSKSYTIDTVNYLVQKYPNDELFLLLGSDNVPKLNKWEGIRDIASKTQIVIFNRGNTYSNINVKKFNIKRLNNKIYDFSSTAYRNGDLSLVEDCVQEYIGQNFLYINAIAKSMVDIPRYKHLNFTAEFAAKLAEKWNYPIKLAYQAGFMHDIAKQWGEEKSYAFLSKYGYSKANLPKYKLHQTCAYYFLRDVYKYPNQDVLNAIKIHTSLTNELTLLDKILFIADKICMGRAWAGIQKIRQLAFEDLDLALHQVVYECCIVYNKSLGVVIDDEQQKIYDLWSSKAIK
ncbi:Probable nicotinate-nucleotide adenylyltransferase [Metamycoplasma cloacale]|uniref:Probable nicotinate-nucleotide adenylyltransferase n=1 Tax=Metamycoplasma cloacale TaxID=92401 RepID=A0A2Z4LMT7_9BACT|nr:nicotinate-nucleotide adenylyltransferase [Metamycoplasma cloacale]AWX42738.1 nicotinate-nucleotide adenylyltransferase [Metamycoplasma cloacale]VEU79448.1 Probable nicotinate-nucleotide adenylyltransferase [Metamycoplasma cloacale]